MAPKVYNYTPSYNYGTESHANPLVKENGLPGRLYVPHPSFFLLTLRLTEMDGPPASPNSKHPVRQKKNAIQS